ncbi:MAG: VWA domain-containing protein [Planctomycetes bacterium]|nr:VWA domain-containing protein [Planctomycetota bacterium]
MPPASVYPSLVRDLSQRNRVRAIWQTRPRRQGTGAQLTWLLVVLRELCRENVSWLVSLGVHLVILSAVSAIVWQAQSDSGTVQVDSSLGIPLAEVAFEGLPGVDPLEMGGGGTPADGPTDDALSALQATIAAPGIGESPRVGLGEAGGDHGAGAGGEGGGRGGGIGTGIGPGVGAGFFGTKGAGKSFVYVVDMSGSMHGARFERAKKELVRSINQLNPEQKFYVYFFNDRTFPLFDPKPAAGMIPANTSNKQRAVRWISSRQAESTTNPNFALQQALEMQPEVIFLLTDGELDEPDAVRQMIRRHNKSHVVIHTIAFENEDGGVTLEAIAGENNGIYRFVK